MSSYVAPQDLQARLDLGDIHYKPLKLGTWMVRRSFLTFKGVYDFAIQGGAVSTINLIDQDWSSKPSLGLPLPVVPTYQPLILPASFVITNVIFDTTTTVTSGGSATLAFSSGVTAADLLAATGKASFVQTAGSNLLAGIPVGTAATAVKIPASTSNVIQTQTLAASIATVTIATSAVTAGRINVLISGFLSD